MVKVRARWFILLVLIGLLAVLVVGALFTRLQNSPPVVVVTPPPTARLVVVETPVTPQVKNTAQPQRTLVANPGVTWVDLDALSPPGRARDILVLECGNCHSFVCVMRGQRTMAHWGMIRAIHEDRNWTMLNKPDLDLLFNYLESNFNDHTAIPVLPEALKDQGCTTPAIR